MRAFSARFVRGTFFTVSSLALLAGLSLAACSQKDDPGTGAISSGAGATPGSGASGGTSSSGGTGVGSGSSSSGGAGIIIPDGGSSDASFEDAGCASHTEAAEIQPVHLVFLMDQSGSMAEDPGTQEDLLPVKWNPVTTALKGFFTDPASAGLTASMIMFPGDLNPTGSNGMEAATCEPTDYSTATVAPTALPSPAFGEALDLLSPPNEFGTPTYPALAGAIAYAQNQATLTPDHKLVIVMVTDGEPYGCGSGGPGGPIGGGGAAQEIANAAEAAAAVAADIPTYVIGVGDELENLNAIAEGGGTDPAILVSIDDPAKTQADLTTAINQIRGKEIACNISLPLPPAGETLDPKKVNVSFTPANGAAQVLTYDQSCAAGGWRYDDENNPSEIVLCESTCGAVTADQAKELSIILGCATEVPK
jgi:hypothetical protein